MIVTSEIVRDLGTSKFIPIIKQNSEKPLLPNSVSSRLYIDLSDDTTFEEQFNSLLRELHLSPAAPKPPLGKSPFKPTSKEFERTANAQDETTPGSSIRMPATIEETYDIALATAQADDLIGWRKLVQRTRNHVNDAISEWRIAYENALPTDWKSVVPIAIDGAATYAPLIAVALAGVETRHPKFNNQRAILDDILYPKNWNRAGATLIVEFPTTLAFLYQALHGAVCLSTGQIQVAINLVATQAEFPNWGKSIPFWRHHGVMGWPDALEGKATTGWETISGLGDRWAWLDRIFGDLDEYKASLCAYYMVLNVFEYVDTLASSGSGLDPRTTENIRLDIPLCYEAASNDIKRRAYSLLTADPDAIRALWRKRGIEDNKIQTNWETWLKICDAWLSGLYTFRFRGDITHAKLMADLFP